MPVNQLDPAPATPSLYKGREPIFPRRVRGKFRNLKWGIMAVTLGIYYLFPWIRWDRGPHMPDQAVLVDLANRRFFFFWIEIWPHEFYFVAGLLIMAGLGLFLFTSALGRVWCGYTCPQTVWTDLFIAVERWIEGDRNARIRLHRQDKLDARKLRLRLTKYLVWLLIAVATGGAWVFYFTDAPTLAVDLATFSAHPAAYTTIGILTATTFFFGGFAREQICIYACPWPRIQAAMMDDKTITVGYRAWRGEPRGKHRKREHEEPLGDCIDCNACVAVCPTGIDIRDGQQLACITCALCIDACDDVMEKIGKPRGLIDYVTLQDEAIETAGAPAVPLWKRILRPRTVLYFLLWSGIGVAMVVSLFMRDTIDLNVARDRNPTYVVLSDGTVRNGYTMKIANQNNAPREFVLGYRAENPYDADAPYPMEMSIQNIDGLQFEVAADKLRELRVFLTTERGAPPAERVEVEIWLEDQVTRERQVVETVFLAPDPEG